MQPRSVDPRRDQPHSHPLGPDRQSSTSSGFLRDSLAPALAIRIPPTSLSSFSSPIRKIFSPRTTEKRKWFPLASLAINSAKEYTVGLTGRPSDNSTLLKHPITSSRVTFPTISRSISLSAFSLCCAIEP